MKESQGRNRALSMHLTERAMRQAARLAPNRPSGGLVSRGAQLEASAFPTKLKNPPERRRNVPTPRKPSDLAGD